MLPDTVQLAQLQNQLAALQGTIAGLQRGLDVPAPVPATPPLTHSLRFGYRLFGQDFPTRFAKETFVGLLRQFAELEPHAAGGLSDEAGALDAYRAIRARLAGRHQRER